MKFFIRHLHLHLFNTFSFQNLKAEEQYGASILVMLDHHVLELLGVESTGSGYY